MIEFTGWPEDSAMAKECYEVHECFFSSLMERAKKHGKGKGFVQTFLFQLVIFVEPACSEQNLIVTILVWCMCLHCACVCQSGFVWAITSTFIYGFQNNSHSCSP